MTKTWQAATEAELASIPSTTGVYEIRRRNEDELLDLDYAGTRESFGLASAIADAIESQGSDDLEFRYEVHIQYRSRLIELVLLHRAHSDRFSPRLTERLAHIKGRLSPG
ncbi:hypothetical protein CH253_18830 [Rhodococcus sp. 06-156-3C]|uniref:hypothetical protein n=1 Tax=Nocardiaceae TaxID=85025 RepID=UPI000522E3BA|nr:MULTISPECIES: hypothetical protein [Rhodococcus]OZD13112.1 hypothetical protein CH248_28030 [Rhodococcus sp. 06-156-4a]OZD17981.1 hypothetical protein CH253_18830 [Rhodococcus sp. 06-156-3C]OZD20705.1 hypothetical protein CH280_03985 [Rhodococcus sp. 06-156-4C]OZD30575.1 hypothetical protein CH247_14745 [Rhodococcus sp. 06-156-3b]OZD32651.1 hypothetical protein CH284_20515 [Rhodococcus sp. 06-156-3]